MKNLMQKVGKGITSNFILWVCLGVLLISNLVQAFVVIPSVKVDTEQSVKQSLLSNITLFDESAKDPALVAAMASYMDDTMQLSEKLLAPEADLPVYQRADAALHRFLDDNSALTDTTAKIRRYLIEYSTIFYNFAPLS